MVSFVCLLVESHKKMWEQMPRCSQMEALPVTVTKVWAATATDPVLSEVLHYTKGKCLHQIPQWLLPYLNYRNELIVEDGCLLRGIRVIVLKRVRGELLQGLHKDHPYEVSGTKLHVVAWVRQRHWTVGQIVPVVSIRQASATFCTSAPMGMACQAMAACTPGLCRSLSRIHVFGGRGCVLEMARSSSHVWVWRLPVMMAALSSNISLLISVWSGTNCDE